MGNNYKDWSDKSLSVRVFEVAQPECESYHIDDGVIYKTKGGDWLEFNINNPSDIMPIAIENKLSLEPHATKDTYFSATRYFEFNHQDENPYRAIAICLLMIKDFENDN